MGRSPCCVNDGMNRGAWTAVEDQILRDYINTHGEGKWRRIPTEAGLRRCGKSCRLRWLNYLRPDIKRGNITEEEEDLIIRLHKLLGNRWSLIAGRIPGRTDNEIKNYWNTTLAKKVMMINQASPTFEINKETNSQKKKKTKSLTKVLDSIAAVRTSTRPVMRCNSRAVVNSKEDTTTTTTSNSEDLMFNVSSENIPYSSGDDYWRELCQLDEAGLEDIYSGGSDDVANLYKWSSSSSSESVLFSEEMLRDWMRGDYFHH